MSSNMDLELLKHYRVQEIIGKGGNGEVFAGVRKKDGKEVAIKRIRKRKSERKKNKKILPCEVFMLNHLQGVPGVISILDYMQSSTSHYIIMERILARDLFDFISNHPKGVTEEVAKDIFRQVVNTVRHCKKKGVLHGDIKDENIIINEKTKEVKLIDFGSSSLWTEEEFSRYFGTREYAPPEWFSSRKMTAEGLTVWSLGMLLASLLCGDLPKQMGKGRLEFPGSLSSTALDLLNKCLDRNPQSRIQLTDVSRHPWLRPVLHDSRRQEELNIHCRSQVLVPTMLTKDIDVIYEDRNCSTDTYFFTPPIYV